ncbi:MAG: hypothetical protein U5L45_07650 [Saprospiraceae bacterium]|nr:hypothetical protein [Saprospiraceae bacterium]
MSFVFRRSRKTNDVSSLLRERSARKTSVFNQKTMFLGYAHSSLTNVTQSRRLDRFFSGGFQSAKNVHTLFIKSRRLDPYLYAPNLRLLNNLF